MTLYATRCVVHHDLATDGIDKTSSEEVRIVQLTWPANAGDTGASHAVLQSVLDQGAVSVWYTMESGPVAEILFTKTADIRMLPATFAEYPVEQPDGAGVEVWGQ